MPISAIWFIILIIVGLLCGCLGAVVSFFLYGRGAWRSYLERFIPPQAIGFLEQVFKECVKEGLIDNKQAEGLSQKIWDEQSRRENLERWSGEQADMQAERDNRSLLDDIQGVGGDIGLR